MQPDALLAKTIGELETRLLQPEIRSSPEELSQLLADDFVEFGSSGQVYNKGQIIQALQQGSGAQYALRDLQIRLLRPGVFLATYRVSRSMMPDQPPAWSLRSSIWVLNDGQWQLVFHQGTPLDSSL
jgi:hypothetical protein